MWSSHVNNGYQNLLKPLNRALYLLELNENPLKEGEINLDAIFLAEIMEINEEVGEAETPVDLSGISQHNKKILGQYVENVSKAFADGDIDQARALIAKMKYYSNIQDRIHRIETTWGVID